VTDDLEIAPFETGGADERHDVGGVLSKAVVSLPVARPAVPREVDRDHAAAHGREGRPDPPPRRRGRRHAMHQEHGPRRPVAPRERRPRDPGRVDAETLAVGRGSEGGSHAGRQVGLGHRAGP